MLGLKKDEICDLKTLSCEIKENDVKRKLVDLEMAKRLLKLEQQQEKIQEVIGSKEDLKNITDIVTNATEIKTKLREMEDLKFLERLEVVGTQDTVDTLNSSVSEMKEKVDLITEAIKNLKELKVPKNELSSHKDSIINEILPTMERLERQLDELSLRKTDKKDIDSLREELNGVKSQMAKTVTELDRVVKTVTLGIESQSERIAHIAEKADSMNAVKVQAESWVNFVKTQRKINERLEGVLEKINDRMKKREDEINSTLSRIKEFNDVLNKYKMDGIETALAAVSSVDKKIEATVEEKLRPALDEELRDVVSIVDTLLREVKEMEPRMDIEIEKESARISKMLLNTQKENVKKSVSYDMDIKLLKEKVEVLEALQNKGFPTTEEVNLLAERLASLETYSKNEVLLEKDFDEQRKLVEDKISLIDLKLEEMKKGKVDDESLVGGKLQEASKNMFEKINKDLKPLVERMNELTDDVDELKELRSEILDDINQIIKTQKDKEKDGVEDVIKQVSEIAQSVNQKAERQLNELKESKKSLEAEMKKVTEKNETHQKKIAAELISDAKKEYDLKLTSLKKQIEASNSGIDVKDLLKELNALKKENKDVNQIRKDIASIKTNGVVQKINSLEKRLSSINHKVQLEKIAALERTIDSIDHDGIIRKISSLESQINSVQTKGVAAPKTQNIEELKNSMINEIERKVNNKLDELRFAIEGSLKSGNNKHESVYPGINEKLASIERENAILRNEIARIKEAYVNIMQLQQHAPIIIE